MPAPRPVILLGHGIRAAGAAHLAPKLLELGVPVLASWQAKDLVDNDHRNFLGCPGIYGNRAANKALYGASEILAIGNRLAIWNVGYDGIRPDQSLAIVTVDYADAGRYPNAEWINMDCRKFLEQDMPERPSEDISEWVSQCQKWRDDYPAIEYPAHRELDGYTNSYPFFERLNNLLAPDEIITLDCGAACASAFQVLRVRPPMRLLSSGGLGEMGCALPAAVGAAFSHAGRILCITGDGGLMMNLAELQTVRHHNLPIKIIVAANDGYLMIKHTQKNARMPYAGVNAATGISCPDFYKVASAFGISVTDTLEELFEIPGPALMTFRMHAEQPMAPKLGYHWEDGKPVYDRFDMMSPHV